MFVFWKMWRALFVKLCFDIRPFALLLMICDMFVVGKRSLLSTFCCTTKNIRKPDWNRDGCEQRCPFH